MYVVSLLVLSASAAPFNTSGYTGAPGALAGYDSVGNPIDVDPGAVVRDILDSEFHGRASDERDTPTFIDDVSAICLDVVNAEVPEMIELALDAYESEVTTLAAAAAVANMGGALGDAVSDVCDSAIGAQVPTLIADAIDAEVPALIASAAVSAPVFDFADPLERVAWIAPISGGPAIVTITPAHLFLVPHVEETAARTYDGLSTFNTNTGAASLSMALYEMDPQTGDIGALIWDPSTTRITTVTGEKYWTFATDGAPTTAGAAYFDSNGDLSLVHGQVVVIATKTTANINMRAHTTGATRALSQAASVSGLPYSGWKPLNPAGTFPDPIVTQTGDSAGRAPVMWLDPS